VIGEVLMVAIVVILAAIVYLLVSPMLNVPDEDKVSMVITNPRVEVKSRGTSPTQVWDVTLDVDAVHPPSQALKWDDVYVIIKSTNGSVLQPKTSLIPDDPATYDDNDTDGIDVEFWFVETTTNDTTITGGDAVKITGMGHSYEGAEIHLTKAGELVARVVLPTNFD
jgi:FlaG/FlaF family flagellin (archaellin)